MLIDTGRAYFIAFIFSTILAWSSFFGVIFFTNPQSAGVLGIAILYISVAIGSIGLLIISWQIIKLKKKN